MAVSYGTRFPQYLSMQVQILWFDIEEWILIFYVFYSIFIFGGYVWLLFVPLPYLFIRAKRKGPKGYFKHLLYRQGLLTLEGYPTYFMRKFRE
ncbi:MAG: conjugal transfer protein TraL [Geobacter sp.]|nr:MAG: conjugal transfer protein TraL [Geobacter sp.]